MGKRFQKLNGRLREHIMSFGFLGPSLLGVGLFFIVPFGIVVYYSLIQSNLNPEFAGLQNFINLFENSSFRTAAKNTLMFSAMAVPLAVVLSLLLALMLECRIPAKSQFRTFFLSPMMVPVASVVLIWQVVFHYNGTLNVFLALFGVDLLLPVEQYQQATRSVKYASLFIILTFVICFFVEITRKKNIHPFQYLLVGLALCLFYTLLISISEYLGFGWAYLIAAVMTIALLVCYLAGLLKIKRTACLIGGLLALLYAYIYILLQMETYALLTGSIGLFIILAIIMRFSLKINWNNPISD